MTMRAIPLDFSSIPDTLPPPKVFDMLPLTPMQNISRKYRLIKPIGRGGMGQVWSAIRNDLYSPCAIKVLSEDFSGTQKDRDRFLNEARIAAQLDHGRIVRVTDIGLILGRPALVMDWVDGVDLRKFLVRVDNEDDTPALGVDLCLFIVGEILAALHYTHTRTIGGHDAGVIHYDVTPGNILLSSSGEVKLTDFGIARFAATTGALSRAVGTPRYMAPEQMTGHPRRETDIYSLGVVLYELLEGRRYLEGASADQFRARVLLGPPEPMSRSDIAAWLHRLVRQMLSVNPKDRPSASAARQLILDKVSSYHSGSQDLRALYKALIGEPRSGLTEVLELGSMADVLGVSLVGLNTPQSGAHDQPGGRDHLRSSTSTGVVNRVTPLDVERDAGEPQIEPTVRLAFEDLLPQVALPQAALAPTPAPTPALPGLTPARVAEPEAPRPRTGRWTEAPATLPMPAGSSALDLARATTPSPQAGLAPTTALVPGPRRDRRWQLGVVVSLSVVVVCLGAVLVWQLGRKAGVARRTATLVDPSVPVTEALAETAPEETPNVEQSPLTPEVGVEEPTSASDPTPGSEPPTPSSTPAAEPSEEHEQPGEHKSPESSEEPSGASETSLPDPDPQPDSPPTKLPREKVAFLIDGLSTGQVKVGSRVYELDWVATAKLRPGTHKVSWRPSSDSPWTRAGTLRVEALEGRKYFEVRLGKGTLSTTTRQGGGQ